MCEKQLTNRWLSVMIVTNVSKGRKGWLGMVVGSVLTELFTYQYRPDSYAQSKKDGGFKIALFANNTLVYTTLNKMQTAMGVYTFLIGPEVLHEYMQILNGESWWLYGQPLHIRKQGRVGGTSMMGMAGHPMFSVDDLEMVIQLPFNDERGLMARRFCFVLENMSSLLIPYGLYITPHSFVWDRRMINPLSATDMLA